MIAVVSAVVNGKKQYAIRHSFLGMFKSYASLYSSAWWSLKDSIEYSWTDDKGRIKDRMLKIKPDLCCEKVLKIL